MSTIYEQINWLVNGENANEEVLDRPLKNLVSLLDNGLMKDGVSEYLLDLKKPSLVGSIKPLGSGNAIQGSYYDNTTNILYSLQLVGDDFKIYQSNITGNTLKEYNFSFDKNVRQQLTGIYIDGKINFLSSYGEDGEIVKFDLDGNYNVIKIINENSGNITPSVSKNEKEIVLEYTIDNKQYISLYKTTDVINSTDWRGKEFKKFEIPFLGSEYPLQGIALDEKFIYVAYGDGDKTNDNFIKVFNKNGVFIDNIEIKAGIDDSDKYEQEGLFWYNETLFSIVCTGEDGNNNIKIISFGVTKTSSEMYYLDGADLNNVNGSGVYYENDVSKMSKTKNYPIGDSSAYSSFKLEVKNIDGDNVYQYAHFIPFKEGKYYRYSLDNGDTWSDWRWETHRGVTVSYENDDAPDAWITNADIYGDTDVSLKKALLKGVFFNDICFLTYQIHINGFEETADDSRFYLEMDITSMLQAVDGRIESVTLSSAGVASVNLMENADETGADNIPLVANVLAGEPDDTIIFLIKDSSNINATVRSVYLYGTIIVNTNFGEY